MLRQSSYTGSEKFIPVRCLDEINEDAPFAPVKVELVIEADAQLVHSGTKCAHGRMVYAEREQEAGKQKEGRRNTFFVQSKYMRPLTNWTLGVSSMSHEHPGTILVGVRDTLDERNDSLSLRGYFGVDSTLTNFEEPATMEGARKRKQHSTNMDACNFSMDLKFMCTKWKPGDLVLFNEPDADEELLGFVAGVVNDPCLRVHDDMAKASMLAVFLVEGYEANQAYEDETPVYLFSADAQRTLIRVRMHPFMLTLKVHNVSTFLTL